MVAPLILAIYLAVIVKSGRLLLSADKRDLDLVVFPFGFMMVVMIVNVTESNFIGKSFCTVLTCVAIGILFDDRRRDVGHPAKPTDQPRAARRGIVFAPRNVWRPPNQDAASAEGQDFRRGQPEVAAGSSQSKVAMAELEVSACEFDHHEACA